MPTPAELGSGYERVIRARQSVLVIDWRRLVQYRDLFWVLVRRDFVARYQQTVLGPLWFVLQPLVTTAAFTLIFSRGLGTSYSSPVHRMNSSSSARLSFGWSAGVRPLSASSGISG